MMNDVAKTIVFDRDQAIQVREMRRVARAEQRASGQTFEGAGVRSWITRLVQYRPQEAVSLGNIDGAAAC